MSKHSSCFENNFELLVARLFCFIVWKIILINQFRSLLSHEMEKTVGPSDFSLPRVCFLGGGAGGIHVRQHSSKYDGFI